MHLDGSEIRAIADALAPRVADLIAQRLDERPELAMSISEAAALIAVEQHVIRAAIADGRLPFLKLGRSIRIKRADLFALGSGREEPVG